MPHCYVAPDWGCALRISGELDAEFNGPEESVIHVGPWLQEHDRGHFYGTVFRVSSDRFPDIWRGRLLALNEKVVGAEQIARLAPTTDADFEGAVMEWIGEAAKRRGAEFGPEPTRG